MVAYVLWAVGLWSAFMTRFSVFESCVGAVNFVDPYERVKYHLDGLMISLEDIETSPRHLHKRSISENERDILASLASLCLKLENKSEVTKSTTEDVKESKTSADKDESTSATSPPQVVGPTRPPKTYWTTPLLSPVKVTAEREGTNVRLTFDVVHSTPSFVARIGSFDYTNTPIEMLAQNGDGTSATSRVKVMADASACYFDPTGNSDGHFLFGSQEDIYGAQASVDLCRFDKEYKGYDKSKDDEEWITKEGKVFSQDLSYPRFKILEDQGDELDIINGEDPIFEIDVNLDRGTSFRVFVVLWDWKTEKYVKDLVYIEVSREKGKLLDVDHELLPSRTDLLKVDVLGQVLLNDTVLQVEHYGQMKYKDVNARVRVTVKIGAQKLSGKLRLFYNCRNRNWFDRNIVDGMFWERVVSLKLPYKISAIPASEMVVEVEDFLCDETGNLGRPDYGKNCTLDCYAWGTDIKDIFIVKDSPYIPPIRTTSYVIHREYAYVKQDMGPASEDNQGTYQCVALSNNGQIKLKKFRLFTSFFTKVKAASVETFSNGTSVFKCSADGLLPLNFTAETADRQHKNKERIDNRTGVVSKLETGENEANLTLLIKTDLLRYPHFYLICKANGDRGLDTRSVELEQHIPNHHDDYIPKMNKNESSISKYDDDETKIVCSVSAVGKDPEMSVLYGRRDKIRIDKKPGNYRSITETTDGKRLTLILPTSSIQKDKHWLACLAKNEFGEDYMEFYLPDYFSKLNA